MGYVDHIVLSFFNPNAWEPVWVQCEKGVVSSHSDALPQDKYSSNTQYWRAWLQYQTDVVFSSRILLIL